MLIGLAPIDRHGILRQGRPYALACASLCLHVPLHFLPHNPAGNRPEPVPNRGYFPHKSIAVIERLVLRHLIPVQPRVSCTAEYPPAHNPLLAASF